MNNQIISSVCAVIVVFAHFLTLAPIIHAQNSTQVSPIAGLRFDTPIPEKYTKKTFSLHFLSSYDLKASDILTFKRSLPTPQTVSATTGPSSILDLLAPQVLAEESTNSAQTEENESTNSAQIVENAEVEEISVADILPSPSAKASLKTEATPLPTAKPTETPSQKPKQTASPSPTVSPTPTLSPSPSPVSDTPTNTGGLSADKIFDLVNNYRSSKGLPSVQKDERACEVARSRAPEIGAEISGGYMHRGIRQRNLPYFNSEIIISMRSEEEAVKWWINDYIHRVQMEGDYKYSCAACSGNSCVQEFTNFVPKG